MRHVRGTLQKIVSDCLKDSGEDGVLLVWASVCGPSVAQNSRAVAYAEGVLTVEVPDPVWRRQLSEMKAQYVSALKPVSPQPVSDIRFVGANTRAAVTRSEE